MITRKIKTIVFSIVAILALSSPAIYASPQGSDPNLEKVSTEKMEAKKQQLYKDLNLTDEQKKLLEENKNKRKGEMKTLLNQIKEKRSLISQELEKDQLNMDRINQVNNELKQLQTQMTDYRLESVLEVRKILTPEQFKKFMGKMHKIGEHFKNRPKGSKDELEQ